VPRLTLLLFVLVAVLGFGIAYVAVRPMPAAGLTEDDVRSIVSAAIAAEPAPLTDDNVRGLIAAALAEREAARLQSHAALDPDVLNPMIEEFLVSNPRVLQRVSAALDAEIKAAEAEQAKAAIASLRDEIYDDADHVVLGNPNGDVILVEMFDYNCGYCRQAVPDLATLLAEDPNLKVILKEFPILSQGSMDAARVAVAVAQSGGDYWQFHQKLFSSRGQVTGESALAAAQELGMSRVNLELEAGTAKVEEIIDRSYAIARGLGVGGTPTYIIGDEIIPGAVGLDALRQRIASMRECGRTDCSVDPQATGSTGG
jgi:protein-disulfide isomerase